MCKPTVKSGKGHLIRLAAAGHFLDYDLNFSKGEGSQWAGPFRSLALAMGWAERQGVDIVNRADFCDDPREASQADIDAMAKEIPADEGDKLADYFSGYPTR